MKNLNYNIEEKIVNTFIVSPDQQLEVYPVNVYCPQTYTVVDRIKKEVKNSMKQAIFKFNNGNGAILCSKCRVIIKTGIHFTEKERQALLGHVTLKPYYCDDCKSKNK